jgi:phage gp37-like protein
MAHADAQNVATRLIRDLTQAEKIAVEEFLADVESDIVARYPDILGSSDPRRLRNLLRVECAVVIRHLGNRENAKQVTRTRAFDDYNETDILIRDTAARAAGLSLTDDEWASLAPAGESAASSSEAFTIRLAYG